MSFDSPAKQQRIERHLMRQRGAGLRHVATSFGFDIGSSQPSSDAAGDVAQPPRKRRKTILRHDLVKAELQEQKRSRKSLKSTKKRKRLPLDDEPARVLDVDDSFILGLEKKSRKRKKVQQETVAPLEVAQLTAPVSSEELVKATPIRRSKRTAAATAAKQGGIVHTVAEEEHSAPALIPQSVRRGRSKKRSLAGTALSVIADDNAPLELAAQQPVEGHSAHDAPPEGRSDSRAAEEESAGSFKAELLRDDEKARADEARSTVKKARKQCKPVPPKPAVMEVDKAQAIAEWEARLASAFRPKQKHRRAQTVVDEEESIGSCTANNTARRSMTKRRGLSALQLQDDNLMEDAFDARRTRAKAKKKSRDDEQAVRIPRPRKAGVKSRNGVLRASRDSTLLAFVSSKAVDIESDENDRHSTSVTATRQKLKRFRALRKNDARQAATDGRLERLPLLDADPNATTRCNPSDPSPKGRGSGIPMTAETENGFSRNMKQRQIMRRNQRQLTGDCPKGDFDAEEG